MVNRRGRRLVGAAAAAYALLTAAAVRRAEPTRHDADPMVLAACFPVMHLSWGAGFVTSLAGDGLRKMAR